MKPMKPQMYIHLLSSIEAWHEEIYLDLYVQSYFQILFIIIYLQSYFQIFPSYFQIFTSFVVKMQSS